MSKIVKLTAAFSLCAFGAIAGETTKSTHSPADALAWFETPFGPQASVVTGDFGAGAHITLIKFADGMATPLHTHSHDYVGLVLKGVTRHYTPGRPETELELPAGSPWFIPGDLEHVSECLPGSECVMAIIQQDAMDFTPAQ